MLFHSLLFISLLGFGLVCKSKSTGNIALGELCESRKASSVGINLDGHRSWSGSLLFKDALKQARPWVPGLADSDHPDFGQVWDTEATIPVNPDTGMPIEIPFPATDGDYPGQSQWVRTLIFDNMAGQYPPGEYTFRFAGTGEVFLGGDATETLYAEPGEYPVTVVPGETGIYLEIRRSEKQNPIRDISLILPGTDSSGENPFYVPGLEKLAPFGVLRPMQTLRVNDGEPGCDNGSTPEQASCEIYWENRITTAHWTQVDARGVAYEYLIELANRLNSDLWLTVYHGANQNYFDELAKLVNERLEAGRRVFLEISNEVWNTDEPYLPQYNYFRNSGLEAGYASDPDTAGAMAFAKKTANLWSAFLSEFEGPGAVSSERIVKVLPVFIASTDRTRRLLDALENQDLSPFGLLPDQLAVGAYFGFGLPDEGYELGLTGEALSGYLLEKSPESIRETLDFSREQADLAQSVGATLSAYEGGQHFTAVDHFQNDAVNQAIFSANTAPEIGRLYLDFLNGWEKIQGTNVFMAYAYTSRQGDYGDFGLVTSAWPGATNGGLTRRYEALTQFICGTN